jgi:hypothetical protein
MKKLIMVFIFVIALPLGVSASTRSHPDLRVGAAGS